MKNEVKEQLNMKKITQVEVMTIVTIESNENADVSEAIEEMEVSVNLNFISISSLHKNIKIKEFENSPPKIVSEDYI